MVHNIHSAEEFDQALKEHKVVVVDFYATWCGPCKIIAPVFAHSAQLEKFKNVRFLKIDVDQLQQLTEDLGVRSMPTFQLYIDGKKVDEVKGADQAKLLEMLEKAVQSN